MLAQVPREDVQLMKPGDEGTPAANNGLDPLAISTLAAEIAEATFAFGELTALERRVDDKLREQVARILNRYEQCPDEVRDIEDRIMEIRDPSLSIALLQQYFLVRSEVTERSIVAQLARLAQVTDRKASELALDALREAARSDISRLANLGSRALFASQRLGETELLAFATDASVGLPLRVEAAATLTKGRWPCGTDAFLAIISSWCELADDYRPAYSDRLQQLARSFASYKVEEDKASVVVKRLFEALVNGEFGRFSREIANAGKKVVQSALASLEGPSLQYAMTIAPESLTYDHVFTVRRIAHRSPDATRVLLGWLSYVVEGGYVRGRPGSLAKEIAISLRQAAWSGIDARAALKEVQDLLSVGVLDNADEIMEQLSEVGIPRPAAPKLSDLLKDLQEEYESWGQLDKGRMLAVRHTLEIGNKQVSAQQLTPEMRRVLILALEETSEANPWRSSARWLMQNYSHFQGQERLSILDGLGHVARVARRDDIETEEFGALRAFLSSIAERGTPPEVASATQLLSRLSAPARPSRTQDVKRMQ